MKTEYITLTGRQVKTILHGMKERDATAFRDYWGYIGHPIEVALFKLGLTQSWLASEVGCNQCTISRLIHGRREPSMAVLRSVLSALEGIIDADDLIYWQDDRRRESASEEENRRWARQMGRVKVRQ